MSWYEESAVYQIYPLGLCGAPYENVALGDEAAAAEQRGKHRILRLIDDGWLDHIKKLGCDCLLLNPTFESDSHGYDTRDYKTVDCRLGTNEDLRRVVDAAHERGIRVLFDAVLNHVGRGFWAFQDVLKNREASPYAGWFDIDFGGEDRFGDHLSYECWEGADILVKLNHGDFGLNDYLADVIRGWEREFGIDGLRLDVAYCLDPGYLGYVRKIADELTAEREVRLGARDGKFVLVGETMFGDYNRWMGDGLCDSVTNYEAYKGLWSSFNEHNMHEVAYALERQSGDKPWDLYTGRHLLDFADNHDVPRIATKLAEARQLRPLYALLFGMCGVPSIYYGSEWGIEGEQLPGDHELRPELAAPEWNGLTDWIASLAKAERGSEALCWGGYRELCCQPDQLVFERGSERERVIVAINASGRPAHLDFDAGCGRARDLIDGSEHDFGGGTDIEAFGAHYWLCER